MPFIAIANVRALLRHVSSLSSSASKSSLASTASKGFEVQGWLWNLEKAEVLTRAGAGEREHAFARSQSSPLDISQGPSIDRVVLDLFAISQVCVDLVLPPDLCHQPINRPIPDLQKMMAGVVRGHAFSQKLMPFPSGRGRDLPSIVGRGTSTTMIPTIHDPDSI
nr:hypothetical protein Iba_chr07bCG12080 [Ipomoea batatas]